MAHIKRCIIDRAVQKIIRLHFRLLTKDAEGEVIVL